MAAKNIRWMAAAALFLGATGASCVEDSNGGFLILQMQRLDPEECAPDFDVETAITSGIVDMAVQRQYTVFPLLQNRLGSINSIKGFTARDARLDTTSVQLRRAVVRYRAQESVANVFPAELRVPLSGTVAGGSDGAGTTVTGIEVINPLTIELLRGSDDFVIVSSQGDVRAARTSVDIVVGITIEGRTLDGRDISTPEFFFNVTICNGCQVFTPAEAVNDEGELDCRTVNVDEETGEVVGGLETPSCLAAAGRDGNPIDCRICSALAPDPIARELCQSQF